MPTERVKVSAAVVSAGFLSSLPSAFGTRALAGFVPSIVLKPIGIGMGKPLQSVELARKVTCDSCGLVGYVAPDDEIESIGWCALYRNGEPWRDICATCWRIEAELRKVR